MCDYSLHGIASRPAKVGDKLMTTQFWNTTTRGLAPIGEPNLAVCLLPGTEIAFDHNVEREPTGFLLSLLKRSPEPLGHQVARFRQINLHNPCTHHDALEFPDGHILLLTHLRAGQSVTVLQLPAESKQQSSKAAPQVVMAHSEPSLLRTGVSEGSVPSPGAEQSR